MYIKYCDSGDIDIFMPQEVLDWLINRSDLPDELRRCFSSHSVRIIDIAQKAYADIACCDSLSNPEMFAGTTEENGIQLKEPEGEETYKINLKKEASDLLRQQGYVGRRMILGSKLTVIIQDEINKLLQNRVRRKPEVIFFTMSPTRLTPQTKT